MSCAACSLSCRRCIPAPGCGVFIDPSLDRGDLRIAQARSPLLQLGDWGAYRLGGTGVGVLTGEQGFEGFRQVVSRHLGSHLVYSDIAIVDAPSIGNIASGAEDYDFGSDGGPEAVDQDVVYISCDYRW